MSGLRAVAHVHSDWSYDGSWTLEALARAFARRGYDAVLMAEHDRGFDEERWTAYRDACRAASRELLVVPGIEYADASNRVHVAVWGDVPFLGEGVETGELLRRVEAERGTAVLAHPDRREAWKLFDPSWAPRLIGVELWNRKYDGWAPSHTGRTLLASDRALVPFVGPDFHTRRQFFPLAMALDLDRELSPASVYAALSARRLAPHAFRLPAQRLARGPAYGLARSLERGRRRAARTWRRARAIRTTRRLG